MTEQPKNGVEFAGKYMITHVLLPTDENHEAVIAGKGMLLAWCGKYWEGCTPAEAQETVVCAKCHDTYVRQEVNPVMEFVRSMRDSLETATTVHNSTDMLITKNIARIRYEATGLRTEIRDETEPTTTLKDYPEPNEED